MPELFLQQLMGEHRRLMLAVRVLVAVLVVFGLAGSMLLLGARLDFGGLWSQLDLGERTRLLALAVEVLMIGGVGLVVVAMCRRVLARDDELLAALRDRRLIRVGDEHLKPAPSTVRPTPSGGFEAIP